MLELLVALVAVATSTTRAHVDTFPVDDVLVLESDADISAENVGKVVFLTSEMILPSSAALRDEDFQIRVPGVLKMRRYSEFCQWNETATPSEGEPETSIYDYKKVWHGDFIDSKQFAKRRKHKNWQKNPFPNKTTRTKSAYAGMYTLTGGLVAKIDDSWDYWVPTSEDLTGGFLDSIASRHTFVCLGSRYFFKAYDDKKRGDIMEKAALVINGNPDPNAIIELFGDCQSGDIRVAFDVIRPSKLSILAKLVDADGTLDVFEHHGDKKFALVRTGLFTLENFLSGGPPIPNEEEGDMAQAEAIDGDRVEL